MKITKTPNKTLAELPPDLSRVKEQLLAVPDADIANVVNSLPEWKYHRGDIFQWIPVLNRFDIILTTVVREYDLEHTVQRRPFAAETLTLVRSVLDFTRLLMENCINRNLYNSLVQLRALLHTCHLDVLQVTLYIVVRIAQRATSSHNQRSSRANIEPFHAPGAALAAKWDLGSSSAPNQYRMVDVAVDDTDAFRSLPAEAEDLRFHFYRLQRPVDTQPPADSSGDEAADPVGLVRFTVPHADLIGRPAPDILGELVDRYRVPETDHLRLFHQLLVARSLTNPPVRQCLLACRLLAVALQVTTWTEMDLENSLFLFEPDVAQEVSDLLTLGTRVPLELQTAALYVLEALVRQRTRMPEVSAALNLAASHGTLMVLLRRVFQAPTPTDSGPRTAAFTEALNMLLTAVAANSAGSQLLVSAGLVQLIVGFLSQRIPAHKRTIGKMIRILDNLIYLFASAFTSFCNANGISTLVERIGHEVNDVLAVAGLAARSPGPAPMEVEAESDGRGTATVPPSEGSVAAAPDTMATDDDYDDLNGVTFDQVPIETANLLKDLLRFLHHMMQTAGTADRLRNLVETPLPRTMVPLVRYPALVGASVYVYTVNILAAFVHNEPTSLAILQEINLPQTFLKAVKRGLPASGDVLNALPHAFGAVCLNATGLAHFQEVDPLPSLFGAFTNLSFVRPLQETDVPAFMGSGVDELIRHHPALKPRVLECIRQTLRDLCEFGAADSPAYRATPGKCRLYSEADLNNAAICPRTADEMVMSQMIEAMCRFLEGFFQTVTHRADTVRTLGVDFLFEFLRYPSLPYDFFLSRGWGALVGLFRTIVDAHYVEGRNRPPGRLSRLGEGSDPSPSAPQATTPDADESIATAEVVPGPDSAPAESASGEDTGANPIVAEEGGAESTTIDVDATVHPAPDDLESVSQPADPLARLLYEIEATVREFGPLNDALRAPVPKPHVLVSWAAVDHDDSAAVAAANAHLRTLVTLAGLLGLFAEYSLPGTQSPKSFAAVTGWFARGPHRHFWRRAGEVYQWAVWEGVRLAALALTPADLVRASPSINGGDPPSMDAILDARAAAVGEPRHVVQNASVLDSLLHSVRASVADLVVNLTKAIVTRRALDPAQRLVARTVAGQLSRTLRRHLTWLNVGEEASVWEWPYYSAVLGHLTTALVDGPSNPQLTVILLVPFVRQGGVEVLASLIRRAMRHLGSEPVDNALEMALSALQFAVSARPLSSAANLAQLTNRTAVYPDPAAFKAWDFEVEIRYRALPVLREVWDSPAILRCSPYVVQTLAEALGEIVNARNEATPPAPTHTGLHSAHRAEVGLGATLPPFPSSLLPPTLLSATARSNPAALNRHYMEWMRSPQPSPRSFTVNPTALSSLMDMGFPRAASEAALRLHYNNVMRAADYLLTNPPGPESEATEGLTTSANAASSAGAATTAATADTDAAPGGETRVEEAPTPTPAEPTNPEGSDGPELAPIDSTLTVLDPSGTISNASMTNMVQAMIDELRANSNPRAGQFPDSVQIVRAMDVDLPAADDPAPAEAEEPGAGSVSSDEEAPGPAGSDMPTTLEALRTALNAQRDDLRAVAGPRVLELLPRFPAALFALTTLLRLLLSHRPDSATGALVQALSAAWPAAPVKVLPRQDPPAAGETTLALHLRQLALLLADRSAQRIVFHAAPTLPSDLVDRLVELGRSAATGVATPPGSYRLPVWFSPALLALESYVMMTRDQAERNAVVATTTGDQPKTERDEDAGAKNDDTLPTLPADIEPRLRALAFDLLVAPVYLARGQAQAALGLLTQLTRAYPVARGALGDVASPRSNLTTLLGPLRHTGIPRFDRHRDLVLLILRHTLEDPCTLQRLMAARIESWLGINRSRLVDTTAFVRANQWVVLRDPTAFIAAATQVCHLPYYSTDARSRQIALRAADRRDTPPAPSDADIKAGWAIVRYLVNELLTLRDQEAALLPTLRKTPRYLTTPDQDTVAEETVTAPTEDYGRPLSPVHVRHARLVSYRCYLLLCLTELLSAFPTAQTTLLDEDADQTADKATAAGSPLSQTMKLTQPARSALLSHLLDDLMVPGEQFHTSRAAHYLTYRQYQCAEGLLATLCLETRFAMWPSNRTIHRFILDGIVRILRRPLIGPPSDTEYGRLWALAGLVHRVLTTRAGRTASGVMLSSLADEMLERSFVRLFTTAVGALDLNYPYAAQLLSALLRPLEALTRHARRRLRLTDPDSTEGGTTIANSLGRDGINRTLFPTTSDAVDPLYLGSSARTGAIGGSSAGPETDFHMASSDEDQDSHNAGTDEEEAIPDLYRNSALGMIDSGAAAMAEDEADGDEYAEDGYDEEGYTDEYESPDSDLSDAEDRDDESDVEMEVILHPHFEDTEGGNSHRHGRHSHFHDALTNVEEIDDDDDDDMTTDLSTDENSLGDAGLTDTDDEMLSIGDGESVPGEDNSSVMTSDDNAPELMWDHGEFSGSGFDDDDDDEDQGGPGVPSVGGLDDSFTGRRHSHRSAGGTGPHRTRRLRDVLLDAAPVGLLSSLGEEVHPPTDGDSPTDTTDDEDEDDEMDEEDEVAMIDGRSGLGMDDDDMMDPFLGHDHRHGHRRDGPHGGSGHDGAPPRARILANDEDLLAGSSRSLHRHAGVFAYPDMTGPLTFSPLGFGGTSGVDAFLGSPPAPHHHTLPASAIHPLLANEHVPGPSADDPIHQVGRAEQHGLRDLSHFSELIGADGIRVLAQRLHRLQRVIPQRFSGHAAVGLGLSDLSGVRHRRAQASAGRTASHMDVMRPPEGGELTPGTTSDGTSVENTARATADPAVPASEWSPPPTRSHQPDGEAANSDYDEYDGTGPQPRTEQEFTNLLQQFAPMTTAERWAQDCTLTGHRLTTEATNRLVTRLVAALATTVPEIEDPPADVDTTDAMEAEATSPAHSQTEATGARETDESTPRRTPSPRLRTPTAAQVLAAMEATELAADTEPSAPAAPASPTRQTEEGITAPNNAPVAAAESEPAAAPSDNGDDPNLITVDGHVIDLRDMGIDPTFLAALPEELRLEVLREQLPRGGPAPVLESATPAIDTDTEISEEFLAALPEDIRREVIMQQQLQRQQRQVQQVQQPRQRLALPSLASLSDQTAPAPRRRLPADSTVEPESFLSRVARPLFMSPPPPPPPGQALAHARRATVAAQRGDSAQLLDRAELAVLARLLFLPSHHVAVENLLTDILLGLCANARTRGDLIALLLSVLQESATTLADVDRCLGHLAAKPPRTPARTSPSVAMSPGPPPPMFPLGRLALNTVPNLPAQGSLNGLTALVERNPAAAHFFLLPNDHLGLRKPGRRPGVSASAVKAKDRGLISRYPVVILLSLLDRPAVVSNTLIIESLTFLLAIICRQLPALARKQLRHQQRQAEAPAQVPAGDSTTAEPSATHPTPEAIVAPAPMATDSTSATPAAPAPAEPTAPPTVPLPEIPSHYARAVVNVLTAGECTSKTFQNTLTLMLHLSHIQSAGQAIMDQLALSAERLASTVEADLDDLLATLSVDKDRDGTEAPGTLARFTAASSAQAQLLRVLKTLDFVYCRPDSASDGTAARTPAARELASEATARAAALAALPAMRALWDRLGRALELIQDHPDTLGHVATVLLPLIEAFMVVSQHAEKPPRTTEPEQADPAESAPDTLAASVTAAPASPSGGAATPALGDEFVAFTERHRKVLNSLVRNNPSLMSGSFALLVHNPKVLEFDNKRNYFDQQLHRRAGAERDSVGPLHLNVRRQYVFEDSFHQLQGRSGREIKYGKLTVKFHHEDGVDAGGLTREWFGELARQMFNPDYALFKSSAVDKVTYQPNPASWANPDHLTYFKFVGRILGKAIYDGRLLDCYFTRSFYKHMLGRAVDYRDVEAIDLEYYRSLVWMLENDITDLFDLTFSIESEEFGEKRVIDLKPGGRDIPVTEVNKHEYVRLVSEQRLTLAIKDQIGAFLAGFHDLIPRDLVQIFNEQELELLISGLPDIDIDDWRNNTVYHGYNASAIQISWFWRAVRSFDQEERAKLLQFVTGTSKVPLQGFASLEGSSGVQKFQIHKDFASTARLPSAHTCFNQLDLPLYESYEQLRAQLLLAINECSTGFGFA
ncbi:E3 ubiquitin-protein ligase tom1 [Tieghemiomyces parasiticus]|uniref:HECT-type E3 ubiquitin transferase n=1 Tax=Tieghemiomyces parasiticus TaxID=78921 RepID=A0A9W8AJ64_9FUNG|nr:E3 ubiquitin-protein ligase tom1 [Tieghemiomyces parasiticus]